jgi:integrase
MANTKKKGIAYYEGSSWFHRIKILQEDGTTKYSKRGGYETEEAAVQGYYEYEEAYKKAYRTYQMNHKVNVNIGLRDYLVYWFEDIYSERIQNTTRMVGAYTLYDLILPHMEQDIKLRYANADYLDSLLEEVAKACDSAGNKGREFLSLALKEAVDQGYIKDNPVLATKPYPRKPPSVTILSKEKLKQFLVAASDNNWYLEILLALFCGLRKGEISGLKFSDFNVEDRTVRIERQITSNPIIPKGQGKIAEYFVEEREPKTDNSYRMLKVPEVIMQELEKRRLMVDAWKKETGEAFIDNGYISCRENGLPHGVSSFNLALTKLCARNTLPHLTVHGLRHMYATILLEQGVPLVKISALLGHASVTTTFEYYCDQMDESSKIIGFMNQIFIPDGGEENV